MQAHLLVSAREALAHDLRLQRALLLDAQVLGEVLGKPRLPLLVHQQQELDSHAGWCSRGTCGEGCATKLGSLVLVIYVEDEAFLQKALMMSSKRMNAQRKRALLYESECDLAFLEARLYATFPQSNSINECFKVQYIHTTHEPRSLQPLPALDHPGQAPDSSKRLQRPLQERNPHQQPARIPPVPAEQR